jgi:hypothetical protein
MRPTRATPRPPTASVDFCTSRFRCAGWNPAGFGARPRFREGRLEGLCLRKIAKLRFRTGSNGRGARPGFAACGSDGFAKWRSERRRGAWERVNLAIARFELAACALLISRRRRDSHRTRGASACRTSAAWGTLEPPAPIVSCSRRHPQPPRQRRRQRQGHPRLVQVAGGKAAHAGPRRARARPTASRARRRLGGCRRPTRVNTEFARTLTLDLRACARASRESDHGGIEAAPAVPK